MSQLPAEDVDKARRNLSVALSIVPSDTLSGTSTKIPTDSVEGPIHSASSDYQNEQKTAAASATDSAAADNSAALRDSTVPVATAASVDPADKEPMNDTEMSDKLVIRPSELNQMGLTAAALSTSAVPEPSESNTQTDMDYRTGCNGEPGEPTESISSNTLHIPKDNMQLLNGNVTPPDSQLTDSNSKQTEEAAESPTINETVLGECTLV